MKFDLIIGNPPYNEGTQSECKTSKSRGGSNFCLLFVDKSIDCLAPDGLLLMITPNHWLRPSNRSPVKKRLWQGQFIKAEVGDTVSQQFKGVGSTFTWWLWSPHSGPHQIQYNGIVVDHTQNLIPQVEKVEFEDWQFLKQLGENTEREGLAWQRQDDITQFNHLIHNRSIICQMVYSPKNCYIWTGQTFKPGINYYYYTFETQAECQAVFEYLHTPEIVKALNLIKSGMTLTQYIRKIPLKLKNKLGE